MIYGTIIPYIIIFIFDRIIIIFSYVDIILVKNAQKKCENNNFIVKNITFLVAKRRVCYGSYSVKT